MSEGRAGKSDQDDGEVKAEGDGQHNRQIGSLTHELYDPGERSPRLVGQRFPILNETFAIALLPGIPSLQWKGHRMP
jgi:hypothetical protein